MMKSCNRKIFLVLLSVITIGVVEFGVVDNSFTPIVQVEAKSKSKKKVRVKHHKKKRKEKVYSLATIKLPAGYTYDRLTNAYENKPSKEFIQACMLGVKQNEFKHSESASDDKTKIDPTKMTRKQSDEITSYTLRLINEARSYLNLKPWIKSEGTQRIADDIAQEYTKNKKSVFDPGDHYIEGIVRAAKKNGLNIDNNYIEDLTGFESTKKMTISELKSEIYDGLIEMIFGYDGGDYSKKSCYTEWLHAGNLLSNAGHEINEHDEYSYFGLSISRRGDEYSVHYIGISSFFVTGEGAREAIGSFKP
ncbi:SEC10/PgrA surface exclusion domain-containing protein [Lactobacillus sp. M0398]|uniref:SEC10/PgrA surface exclusion domain-containing protein n=1 Tax=unclassified Lactobacillus TaxID=2620435 RepID=UPI0018DC611A|nr:MULTISPECIES: SEC10/PgrA surface exclusion domain-containing protein [unclassified Lactobacillus]MBI0121977.1 SEC10/PgrA surface exclusion domain-containing protein [Lactobacillus sp. M0398]MBI0123853.1 SEC10/PgrA surface exclusion domain-containing protein [Lactobacillus sp. W8174]MBI0136021.1 SEC10/PgrA surface exclusion domain-containing protein [Lactobacillus sp. W8173]